MQISVRFVSVVMGSLTQLANLVHESTALKRKSDEAKKELLEISKTLGTFDHHIVYNRDDMSLWSVASVQPRDFLETQEDAGLMRFIDQSHIPDNQSLWSVAYEGLSGGHREDSNR
uniref:Uncharacterized protein n=1 Tax=Solanum lycopersicum TaxID=4081 RepID=A0A3Q7J8A1_SOLLC